MNRKLKFVMVDARGKEERGEDIKGIYRDAISSFWQEFYNTCTLGERERVPSLRHDFQQEEWTAIAHILVKGYLDLQYYPIMLSQAFVIGLMFGEDKICEETLLQSFSRYVAEDEEVIICEALKGNVGAAESEELTDLLDRYQSRKLPTEENVKSLLLEVAHKEIVQHPQYVADCWKGILQMLSKEGGFLSTEALIALYKAKEPTNKKVLAMIKGDPSSNSERAAIDYLKRFIRGMDKSQLQSSLKFVTGADIICVQAIAVQFTTLQGLARRPIAHTCGCVLELPSTHDTYTEFRAEFNNVLAAGKWQNDIV